jgi:hypothetical protein
MTLAIILQTYDASENRAQRTEARKQAMDSQHGHLEFPVVASMEVTKVYGQYVIWDIGRWGAVAGWSYPHWNLQIGRELWKDEFNVVLEETKTG